MQSFYGNANEKWDNVADDGSDPYSNEINSHRQVGSDKAGGLA